MKFVVTSIKCGAKSLKGWIGLKIGEETTMNELYNHYASGTNDGNCLPEGYNIIKVQYFYDSSYSLYVLCASQIYI